MTPPRPLSLRALKQNEQDMVRHIEMLMSQGRVAEAQRTHLWLDKTREQIRSIEAIAS